MLNTKNQSGDLVHSLCCEECGSLPIDEAQLHQWRWDSRVLTSTVSALICPGHQVVELVADQAWVLGKITLGTKRPQLVLFRSVKATQHQQVHQWQLTNKSVIGLFPFPGMTNGWKCAVFDLANAIQVDDQGMKLTGHWNAFMMNGVSSANCPEKKQRKRRSDRTVNIEKITNFLIEFLKLRQDHAKGKFLAGQGDRLLPCPTQKDIAHATKLHKTVVSNCLRDQKAKSLQTYWKLCQSLDVNACYRFRAPAGTPSDLVAQNVPMED